jgi:hypothetical protein
VRLVHWLRSRIQCYLVVRTAIAADPTFVVISVSPSSQ